MLKSAPRNPFLLSGSRWPLTGFDKMEIVQALGGHQFNNGGNFDPLVDGAGEFIDLTFVMPVTDTLDRFSICSDSATAGVTTDIAVNEIDPLTMTVGASVYTAAALGWTGNTSTKYCVLTGTQPVLSRGKVYRIRTTFAAGALKFKTAQSNCYPPFLCGNGTGAATNLRMLGSSFLAGGVALLFTSGRIFGLPNANATYASLACSDVGAEGTHVEDGCEVYFDDRDRLLVFIGTAFNTDTGAPAAGAIPRLRCYKRVGAAWVEQDIPVVTFADQGLCERLIPQGILLAKNTRHLLTLGGLTKGVSTNANCRNFAAITSDSHMPFGAIAGYWDDVSKQVQPFKAIPWGTADNGATWVQTRGRPLMRLGFLSTPSAVLVS